MNTKYNVEDINILDLLPQMEIKQKKDLTIPLTEKHYKNLHFLADWCIENTEDIFQHELYLQYMKQQRI